MIGRTRTAMMEQAADNKREEDAGSTPASSIDVSKSAGAG
jgi:hypothetical protein